MRAAYVLPLTTRLSNMILAELASSSSSERYCKQDRTGAQSQVHAPLNKSHIGMSSMVAHLAGVLWLAWRQMQPNVWAVLGSAGDEPAVWNAGKCQVNLKLCNLQPPCFIMAA